LQALLEAEALNAADDGDHPHDDELARENAFVASLPLQWRVHQGQAVDYTARRFASLTAAPPLPSTHGYSCILRAFQAYVHQHADAAAPSPLIDAMRDLASGSVRPRSSASSTGIVTRSASADADAARIAALQNQLASYSLTVVAIDCDAAGQRGAAAFHNRQEPALRRLVFMEQRRVHAAEHAVRGRSGRSLLYEFKIHAREFGHWEMTHVRAESRSLRLCRRADLLTERPVCYAAFRLPDLNDQKWAAP
jgi:hypothetical protein